MPSTALNQQVADWEMDTSIFPVGKSMDGRTLSFQEILEWLEYAEKNWFRNYLPSHSGRHSSEFFDRLLQWLRNDGVTSYDAPLLFEFASQLLYFSNEDFLALYRTAFVGPITRWISKEIGLVMDDEGWQANLAKERDLSTWYCPITDSMDIASFYHLNQLQGVSHRPGFRSLLQFKAEGKSLMQYMASVKLNRLVLLEDFVGTGTQTTKTVRWAAEHLDMPVLFVPLIIAPDGARRLRKLETELGTDRLQVAPIIELEPSEFIGQAESATSPLLAKIKGIAKRLHLKVRGVALDDPMHPPYSAFGFHRPKDLSTGAIIVLHGNCPNNTIPMVHHHSPHTNWKPLFPRVEREAATT